VEQLFFRRFRERLKRCKKKELERWRRAKISDFAVSREAVWSYKSGIFNFLPLSEIASLGLALCF
jgi:hypothetical protein